MAKFKLMDTPEREVLTEMEVEGDIVTYHCPECGQQMEMGINGNDRFSVSYPGQNPRELSVEDYTNHKHIYPAYLDVDFFTQKGMNIPAIEFAQSFKKAQGVIRGNLQDPKSSI